MGKKVVMANYRSKPVAVHAVQWGAGVKHPAVRRFRRKFGVLKEDFNSCNKCGMPECGVDPGDWIVTDSEGKIEIIGAELFKKEYEPIL